MQKTLRFKLATLLRWFVSLALLIILLTEIDYDTVTNTLKNTDLWLILIALILLSISRFVIGLRWKMILNPYSAEVSFWTLTRITYVSTFLSSFMPSAIAGDLVRGFFCARKGYRWNQSSLQSS